MITTYLFDWGDTLMVDIPGMPGKMCDWPEVKAVDGAFETLQALAKNARIYIATGAAESTENDIKLAFERVGLAQFISGYFCKANLGLSKGETGFLPAILSRLELAAADVAMVGDSLKKDILPAIEAGVYPIWFTPSGHSGSSVEVTAVSQLRQLIRRT